MNILCVLHAVFEKPGCIELWAKNQGHSFHKVSPYRGETLPNVDTFDFLIVMGGPQSPLEIDKAPYLLEEIALIKQAINKNKRIIGVCLGAQLIGEALGAKTEKSPHREIGMQLVELLADAKDDPVFRHFPNKFEVMHWHSDMPGIAKDAVLLAKSEGCPRQAFRVGDRIYGFQCHFEFTEDLIKGMLENCVGDLVGSGDYIRSAKELLDSNCSEINLQMESVLNYLVGVPELEHAK